MACTIIGLFDTAAQAAAVKSDLITLGVQSSGIKIESQAGEVSSGSTKGPREKGFWEELKEMFGTGEDDTKYADYYAEGARRGGTLISVDTTDELADRVADLLRERGAVDVDERAAQWQSSGWSASSSTASLKASGAEVPASLQVAQEQLEVGKRQVARGGVRIVKRVIDTPVEANVSLREERVSVNRRPVGRDLTTAEAEAAFTDRTVELTETGEEAVTAKSARLVEEVVVDKDVIERTEKVRDTVRKTDVKVERIPGQESSSASSDRDVHIKDVQTGSRKTSDRN